MNQKLSSSSVMTTMLCSLPFNVNRTWPGDSLSPMSPRMFWVFTCLTLSYGSNVPSSASPSAPDLSLVSGLVSQASPAIVNQPTSDVSFASRSWRSCSISARYGSSVVEISFFSTFGGGDVLQAAPVSTVSNAALTHASTL